MRLTRRATRDRLNEHLPDGIDGTITGGPMAPIGLSEILERGARGASRGGAVAGAAAQTAADRPGWTEPAERGIALSDGSRICFASINDPGLLRDDNLGVLRNDNLGVLNHGQTPRASNDKSATPEYPRSQPRVAARARADRACATGTTRQREPAAV